jgi:surfeit locus 1 family protein
MDMPIIDLAFSGLPANELEYRRVTVTGEWLADDEVLLRNRSLQDQPGYHLVTPLYLEDFEWAILVDRGWVPIEADQVDGLTRYSQAGVVMVEGILLPSEVEPSWSILADPTLSPDDEPLRAWRVLSIERIEEQMEVPLFHYYLALLEPGGPSIETPIPDPGIDLSEGPHLGYAIQWFSFAAIAVAGGGYWLRRRVIQRHNQEAET